MVGIKFQRPVGPYADSKELEYVSALHQTSPVLRENGTITAKDVMHFLRSRHGIRVEEDDLKQSIITELCGTPPLERLTERSQRQVHVEDNNATDEAVTEVPFSALYTAANIDNYADTYRSTAWFTLVWTSTLFVYFSYGGVSKKLSGVQGGFGSKIALAILNWMLVALEVVLLGSIWVFVSTLGNTTDSLITMSQKAYTTIRIIIAMLLVLVVTVLSFFYETTGPFWHTVKLEDLEGAYSLVLLLGILILCLQATRILSIFASLGKLTTGSTEWKEAQTKRAATAKLQQLVDHATLLHVPFPEEKGAGSSSVRKSKAFGSVRELAKELHASSISSSSGRTKGSPTSRVMIYYQHMQDTEEEIGGVWWTLKRVLDGTLFEEEGIFLHGRLMAVNLMQFLIGAVMIGASVSLKRLLDSFLRPVDDHCTYRVPGYIVSTGSTNAFSEYDDGLDVVGGIRNFNETHFYDGLNFYRGQIPEAALDVESPVICYDFYAANATNVWENEAAETNEVLKQMDTLEWEYTFAVFVGLVGALWAALSIACTHVPSFVASVIKLRSGYSPSLKGGAAFLAYRKSPDSAAIMWGAAFWGILFSSAAAFLFFGGLAFICVYSKTNSHAKTIVAHFIGIFFTTGIKIAIMMILRPLVFGGAYYRTRVAAANAMNLALECWSLGLSIGVVATRFIKLTLVTCFYIGRIDTPMLAPGVGHVRGTPMDPAPDAFKKDLLIHEAHRHPYIERLGLLYLLKIRNGNAFGTTAGAHWRLLFVLALLPWMRTYRFVLPRKIVFDSERQLLEKGTDRSSLMNQSSTTVDDYDSCESLAIRRRNLKKELKEVNQILAEKLAEKRKESSNKAGEMTNLERPGLLESKDGNNSMRRLQGELPSNAEPNTVGEMQIPGKHKQAALDGKKRMNEKRKKRQKKTVPVSLKKPGAIQKQNEQLALSNSRLPMGWKAATDPASGNRVYYVNQQTGKCQWEKPKVQEALPKGWNEAIDPATIKKYFYDTTSGKTQWEQPA